MSKESVCHCDENGYYYCSVLREKLREMRSVIDLIIQTDALKGFAYERGDDDLSIHEPVPNPVHCVGESMNLSRIPYRYFKRQ